MTDMNGEGKLRTEPVTTGISSYEWPSLDGQVTMALVVLHDAGLL